ncbi:BZ3500_MvSof-1268-A1-R1_Chr12-3g04033 [Microbotryum saponariae]|uniref:BZ3500_MvSof-1268-A1-R1_Chr12-3g04033 protein n=1 Tax=Microbotryum saponariae TaxID=289078 RepID=A0A2X0M0M9_9BASI|nr:BZ3500_MvSof-1268-A1-R1_Chr12-3g04033 [Microbotryum saponariae]SDA02575.1 BZ3501_MvSof-1269-A2-R1_Chr12-3g03688 [Microbotryum saponariae]
MLACAVPRLDADPSPSLGGPPPLASTSASRSRRDDGSTAAATLTRSSYLHRLVQLSRRAEAPACSRSSSTHSFVASPESSSTIEHLSWSGHRVVHASGSSIVRTYSFPHAVVRQAVFAQLPTRATNHNRSVNRSGASSTSSSSPSRTTAAGPDRHATLFGPFQPAPPMPWTDDPLPLPLHPPEPTSENEQENLATQQVLERHLLVSLSTDELYVYPLAPTGAGPWIVPLASAQHESSPPSSTHPPSGEEHKMWSLPRGVLIETKGGYWDTLDDVKHSIKRIQDPEPTTTTLRPHKIVQVLALNTDDRALLVTINTVESKLDVWSCTRSNLDRPKESSTKGKARAKSDLTARRSMILPGLDEIAHHDPAANDRVGSKRKRNGSVAATAPRMSVGSSSLAAGASTSVNRRISLSAPPTSSYAAEANEEHLLMEALAASGASGSVGMRRNATSASSAGLAHENRRTSLTRNELSVTMDRMALGQGGGSSQGHVLTTVGAITGDAGDRTWFNPVLGADVEGLLEERETSEWVVEKKWGMAFSNNHGPYVSVFDDIQAFLFDSRRDKSMLAILLPQSQTLLYLSVDAHSVVPIRQTSATHACVVSHLRGNDVKDLLVKQPGAQGWRIAHVQGHDEPITFNGRIGDGPIRKLEGNGSGHVCVTTLDGTRSLVELPTNELLREDLTRTCLQALSLTLSTDQFVSLERKVRVTCRRDRSGAWAAFTAVLLRQGEVEVSENHRDAATVIIQATNDAPNDPVLGVFRSLQSATVAPSNARQIASPLDATERDDLKVVVATLHLVAEDLKLSTLKRDDCKRLSQLVFSLAASLGLEEWVDVYRRSLGIPSDEKAYSTFAARLVQDKLTTLISFMHTDVALAGHLSPLPRSPPRVLDQLSILLRGSASSDSTLPLRRSWCMLAGIADQFGTDGSYFYGALKPHPVQTIDSLFQLFTTLVESHDPNKTPLLRSKPVVERMVELGIDAAALDRLSLGVGMVLREAVRACQSAAPAGMGEKAYELIRRPDLARQGRGPERDATDGHRELASLSVSTAIDQIAQTTKAGKATSLFLSSHPSANRDDLAVSTSNAVRFNEDRRLEEVMRMLQFVDPVTIGGDRAERTLDQLTPQTQQSLLLYLSHRTLALPVGYAMFTYRTNSGPPTDAVTIPSINTSARILPMPSPVSLVEKEPRDSGGPGHGERFEWPSFHAGVAAALQYQAASTTSSVGPMNDFGFDASHISFNKPAELDSKHAGFLFGLGLSGHLSKIAFNQVFEYLRMKHDPTSIGLLLGLAATYLGTGDPKVTSLLSVHLAALHPPNSSTLNVSGMTQAASLLGLGLLHLGSSKRTLADVMVRELCAIHVTTTEDAAACREAYALSAGFSFGLIMLASGTNTEATPGEVALLKTLRALVTGESHRPLPTPAGSTSKAYNVTDINVTSSAATIALAFMYLRTERHDVASLLEIPDTPRRLDYVRADLLLVRTLARAMILWNRIQLSKTWVESHVPMFISQAVETAKQKGVAADADLEIARWSIIAGACFAIGLKFAGTAAAEAHGTLIHYLDRLTRAAYTKAPTVQAKIRRHAIRSCLSIVAVALSMVMAGTGEINVLRRLRVAHGHFGEGVTYGTHLASHMALGLLCAGSGQYTLGTSNTAIAALVISFFPAFPPTPGENRSHLQAYRHLWTIAVEPRCLVARDIDTGDSTFLPVRLRLVDPMSTSTAGAQSEVRAKQLVAPTLIPELKLIQTIQVDTPRYWSFALNLTSPSSTHQREAFLADHTTLWVKRRTGHLSYAQDPRGVRSIFTRSKSETGSAVLDFGRTVRLLSPSSAGLQEFVNSFSDDVEALAMVSYICDPSSTRYKPPTEFEAFASTVLLECLTRDKKDLVGVYHGLFHAQQLAEGYDRIWAQEQISFIVDLYGSKVFGTWFGDGKAPSSVKRTTSKTGSTPLVKEKLFRSTFIDYLAQPPKSVVTHADDFSSSLTDYVLYGTWPSDPIQAQAFSLYLVHHRAPSLSVLKQLSQVARTDRENVELRLMAMGKILEERTGRPIWSDEFGKSLLEACGSSW